MKFIEEKINGRVFLEKARMRATDFTRNRLLPFVTLIYFLLSMVQESLKVGFRRYTEKTGTGVPVSEQAISKARNKLRWEAFEELFTDSVKFIYEGSYELWNGYRVWAIDGSKIALPNHPKLGELFGSEKGSPTARGSILYDVINLTIGDAAIEPLTTDERTLAQRHINALCDRLSPQKDLAIFDRGYASAELIDFLITKGIHFVMRIRRKFNVEIDNLPLGDSKINIGGHVLRVVKFALDTGEIETLLTDLEGDYDFKALYWMRWGVEKEYDVIKNALETTNFSGLTETAIRQDFYIHMLAANNTALAYWEAQEQVEAKRKGHGNKYQYKVNIAQAVSAIRDWVFASILHHSFDEREKLYAKMMSEIASAVVPIRPGRKVTRKRNNRKAKFHHNHKSNL
jgi:hypothetical protein